MKVRLKFFVLLVVLSVIPCVSIIVRMNNIPTIEKKLLMSSIAIIIASAFLMIYWLYLYIAYPLEELKKACKNIKNGNFTYSLELDAQGEIAEIAEYIEEMRMNFKETQEQKIHDEINTKELISNISHDLKTPITAIKAYVEGIMDGVATTPEKLDKYIRTIYNKANDMDSLIEELTFYTKIDSNRIPYNYKLLNVVDFFKDCEKEVYLDMETKNIYFSMNYDIEKDVYIVADAEQLKRVINNILSNSIKYMDKKEAVISINISEELDFVRIEIEDNGKGISALDLPHIFDRFYRADSARSTSTGGSGIGLSIVKKILEDHGARIWAKSEQNYGTEMIIVFKKYQNKRGINE